MKIFFSLINSKSPFIIFFVIGFTYLAVHFIDHVIVKILFAAIIFSWFILFDHFSTQHFSTNKWLNSFLGHISSMFCLVPFNQWKKMHEKNDQLMPLGNRFMAPINVIVFSMRNFWNIKRLFLLFPDKKIRLQFIASILAMNFVLMGVIPRIPKFWSKFGYSYLLFLVMAELYLKKDTKKDRQINF